MAKRKQQEVEEETTTSKDPQLDLAIAAIEKAHGKGAVMFGNEEAMPGVEFNSVGILSVDRILGGGLGKGRIVEIYGPESSGKTTLTLHAVAAAQARGEKCAFIDAENALSPEYARALGVDTDSLMISQPDSGEQALQIVELLTRSGSVSLIVVDSVAALLPQAEIDKNIGDSTVGRQAGLMSQAMRKLSGACAKTGTTLVFINQLRMKIGMMFGNPETTPGGMALKFYASQRIDIRRIGGIKDKEEIIGNRTRIKVAKNKLFPPFKNVELDIIYGRGIDKFGDVLDLSVEAGLVIKAGSWYSMADGAKIGQGKKQATMHLEQNLDVYNDLKGILNG